MQTTKVICNGLNIQFTCHSPESPDFLWRTCIERCTNKWKELAPHGNFYSTYLQGTLIFLLIKSDSVIQIHHWLNTDEQLVPKDIIEKADEIRNQAETNKGMFAAEVQPWKNND